MGAEGIEFTTRSVAGVGGDYVDSPAWTAQIIARGCRRYLLGAKSVTGTVIRVDFVPTGNLDANVSRARARVSTCKGVVGRGLIFGAIFGKLRRNALRSFKRHGRQQIQYRHGWRQHEVLYG